MRDLVIMTIITSPYKALALLRIHIPHSLKMNAVSSIRSDASLSDDYGIYSMGAVSEVQYNLSKTT